MMKKILLTIFFVSMSYTSITIAKKITMINRLNEDILVNYELCEKDHFCGNDHPIEINPSSLKELDNADTNSNYFSYIKIRSSKAKHSDKRGKYPLDGSCKLHLKKGGVLIFDNFNTDRIICTKA